MEAGTCQDACSEKISDSQPAKNFSLFFAIGTIRRSGFEAL
jgi:hypothetical protein